MSAAQDYFPPQGSRWKWCSKALAYSPWACDLSEQMRPPDIRFLWPLSIILRVDLRDGQYHWRVDVRPWSGEDFTLKGSTKAPLDAMLAAEQVGERIFNEQMPEWTLLALANGWRPSSRGIIQP